MDIKLIKKVLVGVNPNPHPIGTVLTNVDDAEAKALIAVGYASEATKAEAEAAAKQTKAKGNAPENKSAATTVNPLATVLEGTVAEVTAQLDNFSAEELIALRDLETQGQGRKGVLEAIAAYDLGDAE